MSTAGGLPASPPTPAARAGPWPRWKPATVYAPGPRTASAPSKTPGCVTCPTTTTTATRSGARSSPSPLTYWPGPKPSPGHTPNPPDGGNPNGCVYASSPSPDASSTPAGNDAYAYPAAGHGTR